MRSVFRLLSRRAVFLFVMCLTGCGKGSEEGAPVVSEVNGSGYADYTTGHASRHIRDRLVVAGKNLANAKISLTGTQPTRAQEELVPCSAATDTKAQVKLPENIVAGSYSLTATNQSGECTTSLQLLQGEPGQDGSFVGNGADVVGAINTAMAADSNLTITLLLSKSEAEATYLSKNDASSTYLTEATCDQRYIINGGDIRVGKITDLNQLQAGYGNFLSFSGGPDWQHDSENSDHLWIARYNADNGKSEFRVNFGDESSGDDLFKVGTSPIDNLQNFTPQFQVDSAGNGTFAGNVSANTVSASSGHITGSLTVDGALSGRVVGGGCATCNHGSTIFVSYTNTWGNFDTPTTGKCNGNTCSRGTARVIYAGNCWTEPYGFESTCRCYLCFE